MIVIVNYGLGNLASIANMGRKAGGDFVISGDPDTIAQADKSILPGVGAFDHGMANLTERGLLPVLHQRVVEQRVPTLGLCLGVQLFGRGSEEGTLPGLWLDAVSNRIQFASGFSTSRYRTWAGTPSTVRALGPLFEASAARAPVLLRALLPRRVRRRRRMSCAGPTYGVPLRGRHPARPDLRGTQFHPEKSHRFGMALLRELRALA